MTDAVSTSLPGLSPKLFFATVAAASAAMLAGAFYFQYVEGLEPCVLCIWQRVPYAVVIGLAAIGWLAAGAAPRWVGPVAALCALAFLADAGIAGFHAGVEQGWWKGTESCTGTGFDATTVEELRAAILSAPSARCDEIAWQFLGLSMTVWNGIAALAFTIFSLSTLRAWRAAGSA